MVTLRCGSKGIGGGRTPPTSANPIASARACKLGRCLVCCGTEEYVEVDADDAAPEVGGEANELADGSSERNAETAGIGGATAASIRGEVTGVSFKEYEEEDEEDADDSLPPFA